LCDFDFSSERLHSAKAVSKRAQEGVLQQGWWRHRLGLRRWGRICGWTG